MQCRFGQDWFQLNVDPDQYINKIWQSILNFLKYIFLANKEFNLFLVDFLCCVGGFFFIGEGGGIRRTIQFYPTNAQKLYCIYHKRFMSLISSLCSQ